MNLKRYFKLKKISGEFNSLSQEEKRIVCLFDKLHFISNSYRDSNNDVYFYISKDKFYYSEKVLLEIDQTVNKCLSFEYVIGNLFIPILKKEIVYKDANTLYCYSELHDFVSNSGITIDQNF